MDIEFELKAYIEAGSDLGNADIGRYINEAENLLKGGGSSPAKTKVIEWEICGESKNKIFLHIASNRYVRAHDALVRIRKHLAQKLGKEHRIGIRGVYGKEYNIKLTSGKFSELIKNKDDNPSIANISPLPENEVIFDRDSGSITLKISDMSEEFLTKNMVDRLIRRFEAKVRAIGTGGKGDFTKLIEKSSKKDYILCNDPTAEIIDRGWVKEFPGAGVWIFMPQYAKLVSAIRDIFVEEVALKLDFDEIYLPRLIPLDVERKKGHLNIANEIFWVSPPKSRDPGFFEDYSDLVEITYETHPDHLDKKLREPMFGLSYAQCEPYYQIFEGEIISNENLWKVYDVNGPTWRWEGGGLRGLERLNEFHRIEFVYTGSPENVVEARDAVLRETMRVTEEIFDLEWKVESTTAVYLEHAGKDEDDAAGRDVDKPESDKGLDDIVKTYDLCAILPFKTASRDEAELEVASFHVHRDFYAKRFHWKEKKKRELWSGCCGIGPTRFAFSFIARWGFDADKWPDAVKKRIGKIPDFPSFENWPKIK